MVLQQVFPGVFKGPCFESFAKQSNKQGNKQCLYTVNLDKGFKVYNEKLFSYKGLELRLWNPKQSKLAAAIMKGLKQLPLKPGSKVLYLGAATGTTASHVSDIVGFNNADGFVWALDVSPHVVVKLLVVCKRRKNMAPLLFDANNPKAYQEFIPLKVDVLYQDIAQRNQVEIFLKNSEAFLKPNGHGLIAVKSRSIDVALKPKLVFEKALKQLEQHGKVLQAIDLKPFEKDHLFVHFKKC